MIAEWTHDTTGLFNQVAEWAHQEGWLVEPTVESVPLTNNQETMEKHGFYLTTSEGRIHLDPAGRKSDGRIVVDMYAWPSLVRVRLLQVPEKNTWQVVTDAGLPFYWDWNRDTFARLVHDLQKLP